MERSGTRWRWTRLALAATVSVALALVVWRWRALVPPRAVEPAPAASPASTDEPASPASADADAPPEPSVTASARDRSPDLHAPLPPVTLQVRTARLTNPLTPVGETGFAVGFGRGIDPDSVAVARGVTDADGRAEVRLPGEAVAAATARGERLWGRVERAGFQRHTIAIPVGPSRPLSLTLPMLEGFDVVGRTLDAQGRPVAARVEAWRHRPPDARTPFAPGATSASGDDGWFELDARTSETLDLFAFAEDVGSGLWADLALTPTTPMPLVIVLRGEGALRGRVLEPSGTPVAGLRLLATHVDLGEDPPGLDQDDFEEALLLLEHPGQDGALVADLGTDLDGRFTRTGLRPGRYWLGERYGSLRLRPEPVPADGNELVLTFEQPQLVVRVRDLDGSIGAPDPQGARFEPAMRWPAAERVVVVSDEPDVDGVAPWPVAGRIVEDAWVFEVEAGRSYLVGLVGGEQPWRPRTLVGAAGRLDVELARAPGRGSGTVTIDARDARGEPVTRAIELRVEDPLTGFPVLRRDASWDTAWPVELALPSGTWRIVLAGRAEHDGFHGNLTARRKHGLFERLVPVRAGEDVFVAARLPEGARLRLTLTGDAAPGDLGPRGWSDDPDPVAYARVFLHAEGRWPEPVLFDLETGLWPLQPMLELGTTAVSEPLPAGTWTLEGRLGLRAARTTVQLVDGVTTDATLRFE